MYMQEYTFVSRIYLVECNSFMKYLEIGIMFYLITGVMILLFSSSIGEFAVAPRSCKDS